MRAIRGIIKNPLGLSGLLLVIFFGVVALLAPTLAPPSGPMNPIAYHELATEANPSHLAPSIRSARRRGSTTSITGLCGERGWHGMYLSRSLGCQQR